MFSNLSELQIALLVASGVVTLPLLVWFVLSRLRKPSFKPGAALDAVDDAVIEDGERAASLVSEQIEERVKQILAEQGSTLDEKIDFGTASDGSLEIWIDGKAYPTVDNIPDKKVRNAFATAIEEFNA